MDWNETKEFKLKIPKTKKNSFSLKELTDYEHNKGTYKIRKKP